jgi:hypothetical protein
MPKCLNNNSKSYKGTEKSPLGLGYCSYSEEIGSIKLGNDGSEWIIKQTKSTKRWCKIKSTFNRSSIIVDDSSDEEIDILDQFNYNSIINNYKNINSNNINFDDLPEIFYKNAFFPQTSELKIETGLEEKFGGNTPFFIKGEDWPEVNKISMTFLCQFLDPTSNNNILYRIFVSKNNYSLNFNKIEFSEENKKNQIIIKRKNSKKTYFLKPYKIENWIEKKELLEYDNIVKILNLTNNKDLDKKYESSKYIASQDIKIGGVQQLSKSIFSKKDNYDFLQLSESNILRFTWENEGIIHITRNGRFFY